MINQNNWRWLWLACLCLPLMSIGVKLFYDYGNLQHFIPEINYRVQFELFIKNNSEAPETWIAANLPQTDEYQTIRDVHLVHTGLTFKQLKDSTGQTSIHWEASKPGSNQIVGFDFERTGRPVRVNLPKGEKEKQGFPNNVLPYLKANKAIPSDHLIFERVSNRLALGTNSWTSTIRAYFDFVFQMETTSGASLQTPLTTLREKKGSTMEKNRLLISLCRAGGIPARLAGGLNLKDIKGDPTHYWTELWVMDRWVPFDPVQGHFAYFPETFVKFFSGTKAIQYIEGLEAEYHIEVEESPAYAQVELPFTWWELTKLGFPMRMLKVLLILPFCGLVVALFRNVVGIRTIGTMLPAIVAVSFTTTGLGYGLAAFFLTILIVAGLHFPLERKGLLQTPKSKVMLLAVVILLLLIATIGGRLGLIPLTQIVFFPIIILSIAAERFARTIEEEGIQEAILLQTKTFLVILACYAVFQSEFLLGLMLSFPEIYLMVLGLLLGLGKWGGLRLLEYYRFRHFAHFSKA